MLRVRNKMKAWLRTWVLNVLFPLPQEIHVYMGSPDTVEHSVVHRVMQHVMHLPGMEAHEEAPASASSLHAPAVWTGASTGVATGCLTVCRYLGRLWKLYPATPESALHVDASLELLKRLMMALMEEGGVSQMIAHTRRALHVLEARLDEEALWLESMDQCSLADVCWAGALEWVREMSGTDVLREEAAHFPLLNVWWDEMDVSRRKEE